MSLWITEHLKPARPDVLMREMKKLLKKFNSCLQMTKLDLRRWRITSFERMETQHSQLNQMDMDVVLVSNYLNTSLSCIRNHYNRHASQMQKSLATNLWTNGGGIQRVSKFYFSLVDRGATRKQWMETICSTHFGSNLDEKEFQEWRDALERHSSGAKKRRHPEKAS
jgi:hypothetical protein